MAEPLKYIYSEIFFNQYFAELKKLSPEIQKRNFTKLIYIPEWDSLELKQRMRHIAGVTNKLLPGNYSDKIKILIQLAENKIQHPDGHMNFAYMFLPDFIEQFGQDSVPLSIKAMEKITCFTSCEFSVRPFILKHPELLMAQMEKWSRHKHPLVRRLASEGSRPRLPWAMALPFLKKDPAPLIPILENLKEDSSEIVRRSVANNLNDIAKDNPSFVIHITQSWMGKNQETDKLLRHACRTLLKKAHPEVLQLFNLNEKTKADIQNLHLHTDKLKIGDDLFFEFEVCAKQKISDKLRLEYVIEYSKSGGKTSAKIFQIGELNGLNQNTIRYKRKQSLRDMTTRKHYPGIHKLSIRINGQDKAGIEFNLIK